MQHAVRGGVAHGTRTFSRRCGMTYQNPRIRRRRANVRHTFEKFLVDAMSRGDLQAASRSAGTHARGLDAAGTVGLGLGLGLQAFTVPRRVWHCAEALHIS